MAASSQPPKNGQGSLVQEIYNQDSDYYTTSKPHAKSRSLARALELLQPKGGCLLDVATGGGHTAFAMAPFCDRVLASDLTLGMLVAARGLGRSRGLANVSYVRTDACQIGLADHSVSWVSVRIAPHHFADQEAFLREVCRVLRPRGRFVFVDNVAPEGEAAAEAYNDFERLRDPSHARCLSTNAMLRSIEEAGLTVLENENLRKPIEFDPWTRRPHIDQDLRITLRQLLTEGEANLRGWLNPREENGSLFFDETEVLVLAEKPV